MKLHNYGLKRDLIFEYKKAFVSDDEKKIMNFLRMYFSTFEDENGAMYNIFVLQNRTELVQKYREMEDELRKRCLSFIVSNMKSEYYGQEVRTFLGIIHEKGLFGKKKDAKRAMDYYQLASQQNIPLATYKIARCYEFGIGCNPNLGKALYFYRCAAKLGLIDAIHAYGSLIIKNENSGLEDLVTGLFYINLAVKSATKQYPYACYELGMCYESGVLNFKADIPYALYLYKKGAALGCPNCQYRLAILYGKGDLSTKINPQKLVYWTKEAAQSDHIEAQYSLAKLYYFGVAGVMEKNYKLAYLRALKAAAKEHPKAIFLVSEFLGRGIGIEKDILASKWWKLILRGPKNKIEEFIKAFRG